MVVQRAVWDNRRKVLPPVQKNVPNVHNAVDSVEQRGEDFVLQNGQENHITIHGWEPNLNQLVSADVILMDNIHNAAHYMAASASHRMPISPHANLVCYFSKYEVNSLCKREPKE
jgi:hypothetical protein